MRMRMRNEKDVRFLIVAFHLFPDKFRSERLS